MNPSDGTTDHVLVVSINGEAQLEYDRRKALLETQLRYLDRMDAQMDAGLRLGNEWIEHPDTGQRATFVALHLLAALQKHDEPSIAASCAWMAHRLPDLKHVKARTLAAGFAVELVFDKPYVAETTVSFVPRADR